jgi:hypothetical protein
MCPHLTDRRNEPYEVSLNKQEPYKPDILQKTLDCACS